MRCGGCLGPLIEKGLKKLLNQELIEINAFFHGVFLKKLLVGFKSLSQVSLRLLVDCDFLPYAEVPLHVSQRSGGPWPIFCCEASLATIISTRKASYCTVEIASIWNCINTCIKSRAPGPCGQILLWVVIEVQKVRHAQTMGYRPCIIWLPCTWGRIPLLLIKADPVVSWAMIHGAWISLGRIGSSLRARRARVETSVFDFGTHVLKHPTLGFFWRTFIQIATLESSLECNLTRRKILTARSGTTLHPVPLSKTVGFFALKAVGLQGQWMTSPQLNAFGGIAANQDNVFNRCKGTVIWRCVTCMFSQALRNTTYCNSTSLQLASLASSFTPFFNLL